MFAIVLGAPDSRPAVAKHEDTDVREIIEADAIFRKGDTCVSAPSVDLLDRESG